MSDAKLPASEILETCCKTSAHDCTLLFWEVDLAVLGYFTGHASTASKGAPLVVHGGEDRVGHHGMRRYLLKSTSYGKGTCGHTLKFCCLQVRAW